MIKKQIINEEILKSIESNYVYNNEPINRFKKVNEPENIKLQLENLKNKISLVDNCDLKNNAKEMVFSDGNINSQIMIVGEGPGEKEDEIGKPFVGDAGNLLNKMLSAININYFFHNLFFLYYLKIIKGKIQKKLNFFYSLKILFLV